jgi:hypothetical protein
MSKKFAYMMKNVDFNKLNFLKINERQSEELKRLIHKNIGIQHKFLIFKVI